MTSIDIVKQVLEELNLPYTIESGEGEVTHFNIVVDSAEELSIIALLYSAEGEDYIRLLAYVDELSEEDPVNQLALLMTLNGELPAGAFCMDPEEEVLYVTANVIVKELSGELMSWLVELLLAASEMYYQEFLPDTPEGEA